MGWYDDMVQRITEGGSSRYYGSAPRAAGGANFPPPSGFGAAPAAEAASIGAEVPGVGTAASKVRFYNRPIGSFRGLGASLLGKGGVMGAAAGGSLMAGEYAKDVLEPALVERMAGPGIAGPAAQPYMPSEAVVAARGMKPPGVAATSTAPADTRVGNLWYSPQAMDVMNAVKGLPEMQGRIADESGVAPAALVSAGANGQPYQPIQSKDTYDEAGNLVSRAITGTGAPAGYGMVAPRVIPDITGIGGLIGMKQAANENANRMRRSIAQATLEQNMLLKGPGALQTQAQVELARDFLTRNPGDLEGAAGILSGRPGTGMRPAVPLGLQPTTLDPKNPIANVFDPRTRTVQSVAIKPVAQTATKADFAADVKRLGSKERVLQEYARRNITPPKE